MIMNLKQLLFVVFLLTSATVLSVVVQHALGLPFWVGLIVGIPMFLTLFGCVIFLANKLYLVISSKNDITVDEHQQK
jgi:hypothetical protein